MRLYNDETALMLSKIFDNMKWAKSTTMIIKAESSNLMQFFL